MKRKSRTSTTPGKSGEVAPSTHRGLICTWTVSQDLTNVNWTNGDSRCRNVCGALL